MKLIRLRSCTSTTDFYNSQNKKLYFFLFRCTLLYNGTWTELCNRTARNVDREILFPNKYAQFYLNTLR